LILKSEKIKNTKSVLTIHNLSHQRKWKAKKILEFLLEFLKIEINQ